MNFLLVTLSLASVLNTVICAPAVSSVHVSFVSGNKATQYSHGTGGVVPLVQYNLVSRPRLNRNRDDSAGENGEHNLHKRSITERTRSGKRGKLEGIPRQNDDRSNNNEPINFESSHGTSIPPTKRKTRISMSSKISRDFYSTTTDPIMLSTFDPTNPTNEPAATTYSSTNIPSAAASMIKKMMRNRVRFVDNPITTTTGSTDLAKASSNGQTMTMSGGSLLSELSTTTADFLKSKNKKPKDSKAVKRSPFVAENFDAGAITFPDFDEFGGDEFGSLRNFAGAPGGRGGGEGGRGSLGSHTHSNPEALSPDGVFLPPLPTEASDYADNDPYLSDPDTAKYAAQHPPFFAAFPHKRAVLALNEQREHNGLEQNILRSIRPFFAFFEASK